MKWFASAAALAVVALTAVYALTRVDSGPAEPVVLEVPGRSGTAPWIAAEGSWVAVAWGAPTADGTDVFIAVSRDAGATFGSRVQVNTTPGEARVGGELPPRVALVPGQGQAPEVVVVWTSRRGGVTEIKEARSRDGGRSFGSPVVLQTHGAPGDRGWAALTVGSNGATHVIWLDHRGLADRGSTMAHAHHDTTRDDGTALARRSGLYYASSAGAAGEHEIARGVCYCCKTALATGPDGSLYAAWRQVYPGNIRDIAFTRSQNGGRSFAVPVRVSEDQWAIEGCPDDGPAIAVDRQGVVHAVWPTVTGSGSTLAFSAVVTLNLNRPRLLFWLSSLFQPPWFCVSLNVSSIPLGNSIGFSKTKTALRGTLLRPVPMSMPQAVSSLPSMA